MAEIRAPEFGHAFVAETIADVREEEAAVGFCLEESLVRLRRELEVAIDIARFAESQIQDLLVCVVCRDIDAVPLKLNADPHLQLARISYSTCNRADLGITDVLIRQPKLRMIEHVEGFGPELGPQLLFDDEILE